jgi:acyl-CoA synthetase (AMP-forming)/AMP-acid ligase II
VTIVAGATLSSLASGGSVIIPPRFSASVFWAQVVKHGATWYSAVPTIHQILLIRAESDAPPTGQLRFIRSCSSSLAPVTLEQLEQTFGAPVLEAYGMTEASHQMSSNPLPKHGARKAGSVGVPTNVEVTIRDASGAPMEDGEKGEVRVPVVQLMTAWVPRSS